VSIKESMTAKIGDGVVTVQSSSSSEVLFAYILGRETTTNGVTLYLDRVIHDFGQNWVDCTAKGAISTVLDIPHDSGLLA
jgi:hypothetical protein